VIVEQLNSNPNLALTTGEMNITNKGKAKRIIIAYQSDAPLRVRDDNLGDMFETSNYLDQRHI
jgi:hypothetical protein